MVDTRVLLISGSTRAGSTNSAVLRTAQAVAGEETTAVLYDGLSDLPAFNPDDDHDPLPPQVGRLRQRIRDCDAVLFCTPEYAGALPGSFKNLLDWTVGDDHHGSLHRKPVAWIDAGLPVARDAIGPDGVVVDGDTRERIGSALGALVERLRTST